MKICNHIEHSKSWPKSGRHIMAQYDDDSIVVYQAYRPSIGDFAVEHQRFGGEFSYSRMSWIKPNFMWMMYRSGWASKEGQEVVLAVRIQRSAFDRIISDAVHSTYCAEVYGEHQEWRRRVGASDVRLQWDPDHGPKGQKLERRAIQLGLRGAALRSYGEQDILEISDVSDFARNQGDRVNAGRLDELEVPFEEPYPVEKRDVADRLGVERYE